MGSFVLSLQKIFDIKLMTERFIWPGIKRDCSEFAKHCLKCQRAKVNRHKFSALGQFDKKITSDQGRQFESTLSWFIICCIIKNFDTYNDLHLIYNYMQERKYIIYLKL